MIHATVFVKKSFVFRGTPRGNFDLDEGRSYVLDFADALDIVKAGSAEPQAVEVTGDEAKTPGLAMKKLQELHDAAPPAPVVLQDDPFAAASPVIEAPVSEEE